jgi:hypothetical protein
MRKEGNGASTNVGTNAVADKEDRGEGPGEGKSQGILSERTIRLAKRIWEAFARHRSTTSKGAPLSWEAMGEGERKDILALAAEALGCMGDRGPSGPQTPES